MRVLVCFPIEDTPGLSAEAAQLALGLAASGHEVVALGALGGWRHVLRSAGLEATEWDLTSSLRKLTGYLHKVEPQIIHAVGLGSARRVLPLAQSAGAGGVVTLNHDDVERLIPADLRAAATIFVPCEALREQLMRRVPQTAVVVIGPLLPPRDAEAGAETRSRFLAAELGLEDGAAVVLCADHFQGEESAVALSLIEATALLAARIPHVQVLIAGDGARLPELEAAAAAVNDQLARRAIVLPGRQAEMGALLQLATVAVGSGRFALEAGGAGVAVVMAGAAGLVGTYTEENAALAHFTCCGRHGRLEPVTARALASEIYGLFTYSQYRRTFAQAGQTRLLADAERGQRAALIAAHYQRAVATRTLTRSPQRIIAVMPDDLRELLFTLPAISALRAHYPRVHLKMVAAPWHRTFLEQLRVAERVALTPVKWTDWPAFLFAQWRPRVDVSLAFHSDFASALMAFASLATHRLGFSEGGGNMLFSEHVQRGTPLSPECALRLTTALGVTTGMPVVPPALLPATREMVAISLLAAGVEYADPMILLCPQADEAYAWPMEQWVALAAQLLASRPERIAVLGASHIAWPEGVVKVMPVQDTLVLATLLSRASLVVAADSAPLHLADLLGVPTVALYGPTDPAVCSLPNERTYPLYHQEYPCRPCHAAIPCPERHCLRAITPDEVAEAIAAMSMANS